MRREKGTSWAMGGKRVGASSGNLEVTIRGYILKCI